MKQLKQDSSKKQREIETLKDEIHDLKNRDLNNERHLSKDSLIITTPPIIQQGNPAAGIPTFVREELLVSIDEKSRSAYHLLKKLQDQSAPPAMILKFVHSRAKDTVYSLSKNLSKHRNLLNGKPVFIRERLAYTGPESDYNEVQTPHSGNGAPYEYLINF